MAICKTAEHITDLIPFIDLLILLICLEEGVFEEFLGFPHADRAPVGRCGFGRHLLPGIGIPLEGQNLGIHHLAGMVLLPLGTSLQHLVIFFGGVVTEGYPVTCITGKCPLGIFFDIRFKSLKRIGIVPHHERTERDPKGRLLGKFCIGIFGQVFFIISYGLLVLVPLGRIGRLGKLRVCQ